MPNDPYYRSLAWRTLRKFVLDRDRHTCVVPGCGRRARVVDHIVARQDGGSDNPSNLRSLCIEHDGQVKELPSRQRMNNGDLRTVGADRRGYPLDPQHHWYARPRNGS